MQHIKKFSFFLFGLILLNFATVFITPAQPAPIEIRVGVWENPPKVYSNQKGDFIGFYPDIIKEIAKKEGWHIEFVNGTWNEGLARLQNHTIDIMTDVSYSESRAAIYDFNTVAVIENWGTLYTKKDLVVTKFDDLDGKTVAVVKNTAHYDTEGGIKSILNKTTINVTYLELTSYDAVFQAIHSKQADVAVVNRLFGLAEEKNYNIDRTPIFFNPVDLKFGFPKNGTKNAMLIPRIDYQLIEMKDDPNSVYYTALEKYILGTIPIEQYIPDWVLWLIGILTSVGLGFSVISLLLKKKVNERTVELRQANVKLAQDIEIQKQTEEALRESEEKTELLNKILIETIPSGVILLDSSGTIIIVNDIIKDIIRANYHSELFVGVSLKSVPSSFLIDSLLGMYQANKDKLENNKFIKKTISIENNHHYEVYFSALNDEDMKNSWGYLFVLHDVTPFVELDNMRKNFISTVSHELRTPISSLSLTLENLVQYQDKLTVDQKNYMMGLMTKSTKVLAEMIEDLLITSRIDNEKLKLNYEEIDVATIFDEIFAQLDGKINEKGIEIIKEMPSSIKVFADPKRIGQIFRIFVDNAVKYSLEKSKVTISVTETEDKQGFSFIIADQGIGIPERDLEKIFTRFYRASNTVSIQGTGLGLSIAKELLERHGGKIKLTSTEGKGTTITAYLPKGKKN
jgi:signal transduction histidine kinase/ABC-type amino acid transport substrate-binding protein